MIIAWLRILFWCMYYPLKVMYNSDRNNFVDYQAFCDWGTACLRASNTKVIIEGEEHLAYTKNGKENKDNFAPLNEGVILVSNHQSYFDIFTILHAFRHPAIFLEKDELRYLPFIGRVMEIADFIFIKRGNVTETIKAMVKAVKDARNDLSIIVYPEGTRSKDGKFGEFQQGAMFLAKKSNKNVQPYIVVGTRAIMPKGSFMIKTGRTIVLRFLPLIPASEVDRDFSDKLRDIFIANYNEINEKYFDGEYKENVQ